MQKEQIAFVFIGAVFGFLAALMAYLIALEEYSHHFADERIAKKMAFKSAVFAFVFFFGLSLILAVAMLYFL